MSGLEKWEQEIAALHEKIEALRLLAALENNWTNVYAKESQHWFDEAVKAKRDLLRLLQASDAACKWLVNVLDDPSSCIEYKRDINDLLRLTHELSKGVKNDLS